MRTILLSWPEGRSRTPVIYAGGAAWGAGDLQPRRQLHHSGTGGLCGRTSPTPQVVLRFAARGRPARRAPANRAAGVTLGLAPRGQAAGPDRLGGQHAEQVEIGRLFVVENAHLMAGAAGSVEDLEPIRGLD